MQRECRRLVSRPLYLFCMVIAPLFCYIFFTTLMDSGLPQNLPAGVVDMDDSSTSRNIVRNLDAFSQTGVIAHYSNVTDARIAVQEGKIYGFFYIPKGLSAEAQSQRQPKISFYTNYSYLIVFSPSSLARTTAPISIPTISLRHFRNMTTKNMPRFLSAPGAGFM